jgi:hypothetical protein
MKPPLPTPPPSTASELVRLMVSGLLTLQNQRDHAEVLRLNSSPRSTK